MLGVENLPPLEPRVEAGKKESVHADCENDNDDENDDHLDRSSLPGLVFASATRTKLNNVQKLAHKFQIILKFQNFCFVSEFNT